MVSLTGLGASHYSYGPSMLFALVPSVVSALFRSTFESKCTHLTTNKRQFAYFLLSSFIPTVVGLRCLDLGWKASLAVSAVLTLAAKYFSDKASPSSFNKSAGRPPRKSEKSKEQKLDLMNFTSNDSLVPRVSNLLLAQTKRLPVETLLKSLIPGDYQVTIKGDVVSINEKKIENEFKFWANKPLEQDLNQQDVDKLLGHIRYRDLDGNQQKEIRKSIYQSLFPLIEKKPINLSFMTGYSGEAVTLKQEDSQLVISLGNEKRLEIEILINKNGNICFKYYENKYHYLKCVNTETQEVVYNYAPPEHLKEISPLSFHTGSGSEEIFYVSESLCYFSMEDEDEQTIKTFHGARYENGTLLIPRIKNPHKSPESELETHRETIVKYALNKSRSCLELLNFKLDEVVAFLENGNEGQAKKTFQGCCEALSSFQKGLNQLTENATSTAIITPDETIEKSSYNLGPMWSPVAASEDSSFTWHITTDHKTDEVSLRLEKGSVRGMMGGTAQREVTVTKGKDPNFLTIEIFKSNTNDLEHDDSNSKYSIEDKGEAGIFVNPLGRATNELCLPFILGMSFYQMNREQIQLPEQIQTDMGFIMKVLSTLKDIQSSPDTFILDKSRNLICDLQGNPWPTERIKQLSNYGQEGLGHSLVYYSNDFNEGYRMRWGTNPVLNSPTTQETNLLDG